MPKDIMKFAGESRMRFDEKLDKCVDDPNGGIVVKTYVPILTPEERQRRIDDLATTMSQLLHCEITICKKTSLGPVSELA